MNYQNICSYKEFLDEKNFINEGLLGKIFNFLKDKLVNYAKKIKASKKIDPLFEEARTNIESYFTDKKLVEEIKKDYQTTKNTKNVNVATDEAQTQTGEKPNITLDKYTGERENLNNILDNAINGTMKLLKKKVEPFIKDDKGKEIYTAKIYAQMKEAQLEEFIINKKIEFFKNVLGIEEAKVEETFKNDINNIAKKTKDFSTEIEKLFKKSGDEKPEEIKKGKIFNYTRKDGEDQKIIIVNVEGNNISAKRISEIGNVVKPMNEEEFSTVEEFGTTKDKLRPIDAGDNLEKARKLFKFFIDEINPEDEN